MDNQAIGGIGLVPSYTTSQPMTKPRDAMKWLLALSLTVSVAAQGNELAHGGFEDGAGPLPTGWQAHVGAPERDATVAHGGTRSVKLVSAGPESGAGLVQVIEYEKPDQRPIIIGGWSKAIGVGSGGDFSVYLDVFYADDTPWWAKTATWPRGSHDWAYAANVFWPAKPVKRIEVYVLLRRCQGTAWVDDIFLERGGLHVTNLQLRREFPRNRDQVDVAATLSEKANWQAELTTKSGTLVGKAAGSGTACHLKGKVSDGAANLIVRITGRTEKGLTTDFSSPAALPALPENPVKQGFRAWTATGMEKVLPGALPPTPAQPLRISLQLARGEHEGAQLALKSADALSLRNVRVEIAPLVGSDGKPGGTVSLTPLVVGYVRVDTSAGHPAFGGEPGWFPDPLLPSRPVDVAGGCTQAFWLDAHALPEAAPGVYKTTVRLLADGQPTTLVPVTLRVRSFRLPQTPGMKTAFCIMDGFLRKTYGELSPALRRQALDIMLDHRLNPDDISRYDPPRTEDLVYANTRGLNAFNILNIVPRPKGDPSWVCYSGKDAYNAKFTKEFIKRAEPIVAELRKQGLADKAYFYGFDERREDYDEAIRAICKALKERFPEVKTFTTATYIFDKRRKVPLDFQDYMDWYCPLTPKYDLELADRLRAVGKEVWWYVCCGPKYPHANFAAVDYPTIEGRILSWLTYRYRSDGLLYWHVNYWANNPIIRDWSDPYLEDWKLPCIARMTGDGVLVYPLADGLASSVRLEAVRDGSEDYDLLAAVANKHGANRANALAQRLVRDMTDFTRNPQELEQVRSELFDALEE
ncbi:MAG: DUF4091 domain-containing protein [Victivallales bacterium]|nr:DUF4091 domain-containing protein [Victivallales bacterium]